MQTSKPPDYRRFDWQAVLTAKCKYATLKMMCLLKCSHTHTNTIRVFARSLRPYIHKHNIQWRCEAVSTTEWYAWCFTDTYTCDCETYDNIRVVSIANHAFFFFNKGVEIITRSRLVITSICVSETSHLSLCRRHKLQHRTGTATFGWYR